MKKTKTTPFVFIHADIKVVNEESYEGYHYCFTIVDDATRWKAVLLLKKKSDLVDVLRRWCNQFVASFGYFVRQIRLDNAGKQKSRNFDSFMTELSVKPEYTSPYSSASSNGIAERANRTLFSTAKALGIGASLPRKAWESVL